MLVHYRMGPIKGSVSILFFYSPPMQAVLLKQLHRKHLAQWVQKSDISILTCVLSTVFVCPSLSSSCLSQYICILHCNDMHTSQSEKLPAFWFNLQNWNNCLATACLACLFSYSISNCNTMVFQVLTCGKIFWSTEFYNALCQAIIYMLVYTN